MNKTQDDEQDAGEITETELEQITRKPKHYVHVLGPRPPHYPWCDKDIL